MNDRLKRNLVFVSVLVIFLLFTVRISFATPDLTVECGTEGCHDISSSIIMSSNSTGNATIGVPFTLNITAQKTSPGQPSFWLSVQVGWADNNEFNFTPTSIEDGGTGDTNPGDLQIAHGFTFTPISVGNYTIRAWAASGSAMPGPAQFLDISINVIDIPDETPPTIDSPSDIEYEVYSTGHSISWTPYDENPISFTVKANGVTILSGGWNSQSIVVNVDYLIPGIYEYTCTVFDKGGNNATDRVTVTVTGEVITTTTDTSTTTTTPPSSSSTTSTGGGPEVPSDDDEVLTTATFSLIMVSAGIIVVVLIFLLILDKWRPWN